MEMTVTILADNKPQAGDLNPALLDQYATLTVAIKDLEKLLSEPVKTREEALRAAEVQRLTDEANARLAARIDELIALKIDLEGRVRRL
jgi:hypothetical protein